MEKVDRLDGESVVGEYVLPQLGGENPQLHVLRLKALELDRQLSGFEATGRRPTMKVGVEDGEDKPSAGAQAAVQGGQAVVGCR